MIFLNKILLSISLVFLLGSGIYFSIMLKFPQLKFKDMIKGLKANKHSTISPLKSMMVTLAARIGVGSIAGIALAIYVGGKGTIFWIWIASIITSILTYCECYLGQIKQKYLNNEYIGGPTYYIDNKKLAFIYGIVLILTYIFGFLPVQANTIVKSITNFFNTNIYVVTLILLIISIVPIYSGLKRIISLTSKIVPIISFFYIFLTLFIIIKNINIIPMIFMDIIKSAFNLKSFTSSFIPSLIIGIQRGIFITESGLGTSSLITSKVYTDNKINMSLSQIIGIYFTVFIICTSTALSILTSKYEYLIIDKINGIELTQYSYLYHLGNIGNTFLLVSIFFLAYSTILTGYLYSEQTLISLTNKKTNILKIICIISLFIGSITNPTIIWKIADILVEILIIINVYSIFKYRHLIIFDYKNKK